MALEDVTAGAARAVSDAGAPYELRMTQIVSHLGNVCVCVGIIGSDTAFMASKDCQADSQSGYDLAMQAIQQLQTQTPNA